MAEDAPIEDALARLGRSRGRSQDSRKSARKQGIKAQLFGDVAPPRRIGRFLDLGLLGHGAMGTVRRAYDDRLAREVAIKLVRRTTAGGHGDRMLREAQALAQLSHPNVVQIYEVGETKGETEGEIFIAMELVDGTPLDQWQREPRGWRECVRIYLQAGRGLAAAHAAGLVHRDFKPANCIRDAEGRVRVLDFGLARAAESPEPADAPPPVDVASTTPGATTAHGSGRITASDHPVLHMQITARNAVVGTIAYMAPEQYVGGRTDAKSDQFSFCVSLYEALYGERPFGKDPRSALVKLAAGAALAPAFGPAPRPVPGALRRALRRGLAGKPEARWPSMDALLHALERPLRGSWRGTISTLGITMGGTTAAVLALVSSLDPPCAQDRERLQAQWGHEQHQQVRAALLATGAPYAHDTWRTVEHELDAYADAWLEVCEATDRTRDQPARYASARRCLRARQHSLGHVVDLLTHADEDRVRNAAQIVAVLPAVEPCTRADAPASSSQDLDSAQIAQGAHGAQSVEQTEQIEQITALLDRARLLDAATEYDQGLELATRATALAQALGDPVLEARALVVEGHLYVNAERFDQAEASLRAGSTLALRHDDDEVAAEAKALWSHVVGIVRARAEVGRMLADDAVSLAERPGVSLGARAMALMSRGDLWAATGELEPARASFEGALQLLVQEHGAHHLALVEPLDHLASVLRQQGELETARAHRERALQIHRRWQGEQHPATALTQTNLASILYDQGEVERARRELEPAIATLEQALGPHHGQLASPHNSLGAMLAQLGEPAKAEREYREAIRIWERTRGPHHPDAIKTRLNLAAELHKQRKLEAAVEQATMALQSLDRSEPTRANVQLSASARQRLGRLSFDLGDLDAAEAHYRDGLEGLERLGSEPQPLVASLLNSLGDVALARDDVGQATASYRRAMKIYVEVYGQDHSKVTQTQHRLDRAQE